LLFHTLNNQWWTWFQEESLWEEGGRRKQKGRSVVGEETIRSESLVLSSVEKNREVGYLRPQPPTPRMLGVRPASSLLCGEKDSERWEGVDVGVGLEILCMFTDPGR